MPYYKCCQCEMFRDDEFVRYRTYIERFDDIVGDRRWRVCQECSDDNHRYTRKVYTIMGVCFVAFILWSLVH